MLIFALPSIMLKEVVLTLLLVYIVNTAHLRVHAHEIMGRPSLAETAHPGRQCTECTHCGKKQEEERKPLKHVVNWDESERDTLQKDFGLSSDCCLCDKCRLQIQRTMKGQDKKSKKKQRPPCYLSQYHLCEEESYRETQEEWSQVVASFNLQESSPTEFPSTISLCQEHYRKLFASKRVRCSNCQNLVRGNEKKCPEPDVINEFNKDIGIQSFLTDNSIVCLVCFNQFRQVIYRNEKLKTASTTRDLEEIIQSHEQIAETAKDRDLDTYASAKAVVFTGQQFRQNRAVLLKQVYIKYQQYRQEAQHECGTQGHGTNVKSNQSLMLDLIKAYGHHLMYVTSKIRLHGTMLMRKGSDVTAMLHTVMYEQLTRKTAEATSTSSQEVNDPESTSSHQVLSKAAQQLNSELRRQSLAFANQAGRGQDFTVFNADSCIEEIHPLIWNFFYLLSETTMEQRERDRLQDFTWNTRYRKARPIDYIQASDIRRLFNICHTLFLMNDKSSYPLHLLLADTVQCQGGTQFLLQVLNRLGITSSRTTLDAHKNAVVVTNLHTMGRKLDSPAFAFASVDNIDKGSPHAVVTADGKPRSVHGTSYQVVFTQPSRNVNVGDDYIPCSTARRPQKADTLKTIKVTRDNKNLYKLLASRNNPTLRNCQRNDNGVPTSTHNKELEAFLAQCYKEELINVMTEHNTDFMDEVGELLPVECLDVTARLELLKRESAIPSEIEASAVAFLAKCPVQIYRPGSSGRFLHREFGACFQGVEPLQLLQDATGFDLLVSDELASSTANLTGHGQSRNFEVFRAWRDKNAFLLHEEQMALSISVSLQAGQVVAASSAENLPEPPKRKKTKASDIDTARTSTGSQYTPSRTRSMPQTIHTLNDFKLQPSEALEEKKAREKLTSLVFNRTPSTSATPSMMKEAFSPSEPPEKSNAVYLGVLNEHADNIEAVLHTLEKLQDQMEVGTRRKHLIVVGDAKTYVHLCKIKQDYAREMEWMQPFPGDWHILKNLQPVIMKIYWHAGLQDLAKKNYKGATLSSLALCSNFRRTHHFLLNAWEAIFKCQLAALRDIDPASCHQQMLDLASKLGSGDETYRFWWTFTNRDMMSYIMLYLSMRTGNWELRVAALKKMAPLFHAFDRPMYLRLIPIHLHDLLNMPDVLLTHLKEGGFAVSITGSPGESLGADESHESLINRDVKMALHVADPQLMDRLALYLPYRAMGQKNLRNQLFPSPTPSQNQRDPRREAIINLYIDTLQDTAVTVKEPRTVNLHTLVDLQPADEVQRSDMNQFYEVGARDLEAFISTRILHTPSVQAPRRKRALRTFLPKQPRKKRINQKEKNKRIVAACLRRQVAHAKKTGEPIQKLGQYIQYPLAIAKDDGSMYKGSKSVMTSILKKRYEDVFVHSFPPGWSPQCVILEGMFLINSVPLASHKTFKDYALRIIHSSLLFHIDRGVAELHLIFDHPDRHGLSPKALEKQRRDELKSTDEHDYQEINADTQLPSNWRKFLGDRRCKRLLVNFLSSEIPKLIQEFLSAGQTLIVAGGFDHEGIDSAVRCDVGGIQKCPHFASNHEEGDSRVWFHACQTVCKRICIYSPDTDTYHIGMPLLAEQLKDKEVIVQLSLQKCDHMYCNLNVLQEKLLLDPDLHHVPSGERLAIMQKMYICSGCDYTSFFAGCGKTTFYSALFQYAEFVTSGVSIPGLLSDDDAETSLLAFYRLVGAVYFKKYFSAFRPMKTPFEVYKSIDEPNQTTQHKLFLDKIREATWEKADFEDGVLPSNEALHLHWKRSSWVSDLWAQASKSNVSQPSLVSHGYILDGDRLAVHWDTEENAQSVEIQVDWILKGCKCGTGCATKRCKCTKGNRSCGPSCQCTNCQNPYNTAHASERRSTADELVLHNEEVQTMQQINPDNLMEIEMDEEEEEIVWEEDAEVEESFSDEDE